MNPTRGDAGTLIRYRDTLAAHTTFRVFRCVGPHGRCSKLTLVGTFSHHDRAGTNSLRFSGRLHGRALAPGRYMLKIFASLAGLRSPVLISSSRSSLRPHLQHADHDSDCDQPGQR